MTEAGGRQDRPWRLARRRAGGWSTGCRTALALFGVLAVAKLTSVWGSGIPVSAATPLAILGQDAAVALAFGLSTALLPWRQWRWSVFALLSLHAALHAGVVRALGTPLTWPMLRATDPALGDSIGHYLTPANLWAPALVLAVAALVPIAMRRLARRAVGLGAGALSVVAVGGTLAQHSLRLPASTRNGLVTLVATALPRLPATERSGDWRRWRREGRSSPELRGAAAGRNVVLVVLESAAAGALRPYGAEEDPMPFLSGLARRGLVFSNAYAVYPESIKGLVALQHSVHPAPDTAVERYRHVPVPSLAELLARAGYRTALFHPGRFRYLGMAEVIAAGGYHVTRDASALGGRRESSFGVDEESAVAGALEWIAGLPPDRPFFLTYMPVAGHHPYDSPKGGPFPYDTVAGCYRNALHYADRSLAALVEGLRARGLHEDTLLCVVGDHGQAFGEHAGNFGHTFHLYEENVRVPLVFSAPGVLQPCRLNDVASHVDVAPTILDLLGLPPADGHEGRSLLDRRTGLALMFTDYATMRLALRDGPWKYHHEVESGRDLLFHLPDDAGEERNLADGEGTRVADYRAHLLSWAAAQRATVATWSAGAAPGGEARTDR